MATILTGPLPRVVMGFGDLASCSPGEDGCLAAAVGLKNESSALTSLVQVLAARFSLIRIAVMGFKLSRGNTLGFRLYAL